MGSTEVGLSYARANGGHLYHVNRTGGESLCGFRPKGRLWVWTDVTPAAEWRPREYGWACPKCAALLAALAEG